MYILVLVSSAAAAAIAVCIMTYISLATPLGPWIEPVFALALVGISQLSSPWKKHLSPETMSCILAASGVAGISAVGCAFSYPTLFFLDQHLFHTWIISPWFFVGVIGGLVVLAGAIALFISHLFESFFLTTSEFPFPEVRLVHRIMTIANNGIRSLQFFAGAGVVIFFEFVQSVLKKFFTTASSLVKLNSVPLLLSLGFVAGHLLLIPLSVGLSSKFIIIEPIRKLFFAKHTLEQIIPAWCAGIVLYSASSSLFFLGKGIWTSSGAWSARAKNTFLYKARATKQHMRSLVFVPVLLASYFLFFGFFDFSLLSSFYVLIGTIACTYQLIKLAGEIGLAPLGRFATFVMLPGLIMFGFSGIQATLVALFVELVGGMGVDLIFGKKLMSLTHASRSRIFVAQCVGILVSAVIISILMWKIGALGTFGKPPFIAHRAYMRALLIKTHDFNFFLMACGAGFAFLIRRLRINLLLMLSGLLMPLDYVLPLIVGSAISFVPKDRQTYYPFSAGAFATSSLIMMMRSLMGAKS